MLKDISERITEFTLELGGRCEIMYCDDIDMFCVLPKRPTDEYINYKIIISYVSKKKVEEYDGDKVIALMFKRAFRHKSKTSDKLKTVNGCTVFTKKILENYKTIVVFVNDDVEDIERICITVHELGHISNGDHLNIHHKNFAAEIRADIYAAKRLNVHPMYIAHVALISSIERIHGDLSYEEKTEMLNKRLNVYKRWFDKVVNEEYGGKIEWLEMETN